MPAAFRVTPPPRHRARAATCALGAACAVAVHAADTERADIEFAGRTYAYTFVSRLAAPAAEVHAVVTDFDDMRRINDDIVEARVLARYPDGSLKRLLKLKHCILMFCFDMDFVERVTETPGHVATVMVPAESSFSDGTAAWSIEALDGRHTRVTVSARQTPRFWIPPVLGPLILKQVFLKEVAETCANIERIAAAQEHHG